MPRIDISDVKLEERVVRVNRVAKVVKGGRRFSFSAMVVVGDGSGLVGAGIGKAGEVPEAIRKGVEQARKNVIRVPTSGTTIPHRVDVDFGASKVMLKPAAPGTGVIAGGAVRAVVEAAGIRDILSKNYGSNNPINVVKAAIKGLQELRSPEAQAAARGKSVGDLQAWRREEDKAGAQVEAPDVDRALTSTAGPQGEEMPLSPGPEVGQDQGTEVPTAQHADQQEETQATSSSPTRENENGDTPSNAPALPEETPEEVGDVENA